MLKITDEHPHNRILRKARYHWHLYIEAQRLPDTDGADGWQRERAMTRAYASTMTALVCLHILRGDTIVHPSLTTRAIRGLNS